MKNTLERINSRIIEAGERINDLEEKMVELSAMEQNKEKTLKRNEDSLRDLRKRMEAKIEKMQEMFNKDLEN